jgi:hypothetical protein
MTPKNYPPLNKLSDRLFSMVSQGLSSEQSLLLMSKWPQVRQIAAQNAGYRSWGNHLLKLNAPELDRLQATFKETICSIESKNIDLIQTFMAQCPDLIGLRFLLDDTVQLNNLPLHRESAIAFFLAYNPTLVAAHRVQFQEFLKLLVSQSALDERDILVAQMFVGNLIALLPYFDLDQGAMVDVPIFVTPSWQLIPYQVVHIPLVENKIIAYGLEPQATYKTASILIFRGTPYPAAAGFLDALLSDLHPTKSIGKDIFEQGKAHIDQWMKGKNQVECYGMSLGGALAYHAGESYPVQMRVHAYGAPGLVPMQGNMKNIRGEVFFHHQDLVKLVGFHPESKHFQIYALLTAHEVNFILAHARPPGIGPTLVLKVNPLHENRTWSRYAFTIGKTFISTLFFSILFPIRLGSFIGQKIRSFSKKFL